MRRAFCRRIERLGLANVTVLQADACDLREVVAAKVGLGWRPSRLQPANRSLARAQTVGLPRRQHFQR